MKLTNVEIASILEFSKNISAVEGGNHYVMTDGEMLYFAADEKSARFLMDKGCKLYAINGVVVNA